MDIRNIMDTVQEVALAFKFSAKRVLAFEEQLMNNAAVMEEIGRQSKVKVLCETLGGKGRLFFPTEFRKMCVHLKKSWLRPC